MAQKDRLSPILCWTGGKTKLKTRILKLIPEHKVYSEPFVGGGSIFFAKPLVQKNVINDKNKGLIQFYKRFANTRCGQLDSCRYPANKTTYKALVPHKNQNVCTFLAVNKRTYGCKTNEHNFTKATTANHPVNVAKNCERYKEKLKKTTILNEDWKKVFKRYDSKDTFTYLDPPYVDTYDYGQDKVEPEDVCRLVKSAKGKVLLSYNNHPRVRKACHGLKMRKVNTLYEMQKSVTKDNKPAVELLISNY